MNKIVKICLVPILVFSITTLDLQAWATTDQTSGQIVLTASVVGSTSLSATSTLSFDATKISAADLNTESTYWVLAGGYIDVQYSSNYTWGIRIITDNDAVVDTIVGSNVAISDYIVPTLDDGDGDGVMDDYYSGMIRKEDVEDIVSGGTLKGQDPSNKVVLAWQAYDEYDSSRSVTAPSATRVASDVDLDGIYGDYVEDSNVGDVWTVYDDWNYIGDKSDDLFSDEVFIGSTRNIAGPIVAIGSSGSYGRLVPATSSNVDGKMISLTDGDLVIYVSGRFVNTNWGDGTTEDPFAHIVEPGSYTTYLYVELIHE